MKYWYDEQLRRYILQFVRIFANFKVKEGGKGTQEPYYNQVPVRYADMSRMVAHILRQNSENMINSTPFIACSIQQLAIARDRTHEPNFIDKKQITERKYDKETNSYNTLPGNQYTIERYMPVPYNLTMQVDIWTPNTDTKMQLLEQILVLFNPTIQIQANTNPLDWTNIVEVELIDLQWTSRTQPVGVDEQIDIASLTFQLPIWLNPPAKVKKQEIVEQIVADIKLVDNLQELGYDDDIYDFFGDIENAASVIVTPGNYRIGVSGTEVQLLSSDSLATKKWNADLLDAYGKLRDGVSILELRQSNDHEDHSQDIIGTVTADTTDTTKLVLTIDQDTLPPTTLDDIAKIIDPQVNYPGDGTLDPVFDGQRYLITEEISASGYPNWGIDAQENDIIQYSQSSAKWVVVFDASSYSGTVPVLKNLNTSKRYKFVSNQWISVYEGEYNPGFWKLVL